MVERHESNDGETEPRDLSMSKNNPSLDTAEILRRQGPEFEPPKEDNTEKQQYIQQSTGQTTISSSADSATQVGDKEDQQKKDKELAQEIETLKQKDQDLKEQRLAEVRKEIQQLQQNKEQDAQTSNSETDQNEDYYQGMGQ